jgi:hypothetical protein
LIHFRGSRTISRVSGAQFDSTDGHLDGWRRLWRRLARGGGHGKRLGSERSACRYYRDGGRTLTGWAQCLALRFYRTRA